MKSKFTIENSLPLVSMMFPYIIQFSIRWRMEYGEYYKYELGDWTESLTDS